MTVEASGNLKKFVDGLRQFKRLLAVFESISVILDVSGTVSKGFW